MMCAEPQRRGGGAVQRVVGGRYPRGATGDGGAKARRGGLLPSWRWLWFGRGAEGGCREQCGIPKSGPGTRQMPGAQYGKDACRYFYPSRRCCEKIVEKNKKIGQRGVRVWLGECGMVRRVANGGGRGPRKG
ncbi:hypothetical protein HWV62_13018 [Athelia sp. TMB]|nr:hypothetical protein HWV62_13018 [Athelia sp. TMB]